MSASALQKVLTRYLPPQAVASAVAMWQAYPFHFTVTRKRSSKYGDYRYDPVSKEHTITVNGDLNPFAFLVTYVHEFAHLTTIVRFGTKVSPHGVEWQEEFKQAAIPFLTEAILPPDVLRVWRAHMVKPRASTTADLAMITVLRRYDQHNRAVPLFLLPEQSHFAYNGKVYVKGKTLRTRLYATELPSGKRYLFHKGALVEQVDTAT
jgi:hypothetical protein